MRTTTWRGKLLLPTLLAFAALVPGAAMAQDAQRVSGGESPTFGVSEGRLRASDQVIVKFDGDTTRAARSDIRRQEGIEKKEELDLIDAEVVEVEGQSVRQTIEDLEARPNVKYAVADQIVHPTGYTDEPRFGEMWGLHNTGQRILGKAGKPGVDINALQASRLTQGKERVVVAVIDDGADFSHPDLAERAWVNPGESGPDASGNDKATNGIDDDGNGFVDDVNGWDFANGDNTVHDFGDDFHGTHVSGTIAASVNGEGVVGVAPNVKIMALKFLGPFGGTTSDAIKAIEYAKSKGARISNNSWGCSDCPPNRALKEAIEKSRMLFVAAAGNGGFDGKGDDNDRNPKRSSYPASYDSPNVLSVAAVNNQGGLARFSNFGARTVDISAPGVDVLSSVPVTPEQPGVTLSSVGNGEALVTGFGVEEVDRPGSRAAFMASALDAVGREDEEVVLVDDDRSAAFEFMPDAGPSLSSAIQTATGSAPEVIEVPEGSGPGMPRLEGKVVVWATGQAFDSSFDPAPGGVSEKPLTREDRTALTSFLKGGGKLVLTGMDALLGIEESAFVLDTLKLDVRDGYPTTTFSGSAGTAFAGETYSLTGDLSFPFHYILKPLDATATPQGVIGADPYEYFGGTSMATPHVTETAALVVSESPRFLSKPGRLKKAVMGTGRPLASTRGKTVTGDMVDANAAVRRSIR